MPITPMVDYDIVVIGAGIVGLSTALALSHFNLRIAIVEKELFNSSWESTLPFEVRVSALTQPSILWLKHSGLWQAVENMRVQSVKRMEVWAEGSDSTLHLCAKDAGRVELAAIVENAVLQKSLLQACKSNQNIQILAPYTLEALNEKGTLEVVLNERTIKTALVIGTDGAYSKVRALANISHQETPYHQQAIVANLTSDRKHLKTASQRFLKEGPLAFLPLPEASTYSIVWSSNSEKAQELLALDNENFCEKLEEAIEHRLGKLSLISERKAFPLIKRHANAYGKPGVLLLGDAAHTIHPLAGLGLNLGLADVMSLEKIIKRALEKKRPLNDPSVLKRFEQQRRAENEWVQEGMDWINRFYVSDSLQWIRENGTKFLNKYSYLKSLLVM